MREFVGRIYWVVIVQESLLDAFRRCNRKGGFTASILTPPFSVGRSLTEILQLLCCLPRFRHSIPNCFRMVFGNHLQIYIAFPEFIEVSDNEISSHKGEGYRHLATYQFFAKLQTQNLSDYQFQFYSTIHQASKLTMRQLHVAYLIYFLINLVV